jgi:hypothetical protein
MRIEVPVSKYRHVAQMPPPPRAEDGELVERITALWRRAASLAPPSVIRGVLRFRSIDEANTARDAATRQRVRWLRGTPVG